MREDFEIYPIRSYDGSIKYAFNVEYYGYYVCDTMEKAQQKVTRVRQQVKARLEEIERLNKEYYKKLAKKQEKILQTLKEAKNGPKEHRAARAEEIHARKRIVRALIMKGFSNEEIMLRHPEIPLRSISHIRSAINRSQCL
jgi:primosomal protein N'